MMTTGYPSEHDEQVGFVTWFRARFPGVRIVAIPNGHVRDMATARRIKAEGGAAGVPDLFVPAWGVWVEMKRVKGGKLSDAQMDWMAYLEDAGHTVIVGCGARDASEKILRFRQEKS